MPTIMKPLPFFAAVLLCLLLGACAATPAPPLTRQVLALADDAKALQTFDELALRHRDSYDRLRPYLNPQQDASEQAPVR